MVHVMDALSTFKFSGARNDLEDSDRRRELLGWLASCHTDGCVITTTLANDVRSPGLHWWVTVMPGGIGPPSDFIAEATVVPEWSPGRSQSLLFGFRPRPEEVTSTLRDSVLSELTQFTFLLQMRAVGRTSPDLHDLQRELESVFANVAGNKLDTTLAGRVGTDLFSERHQDLVAAVAHGGWTISAQASADEANLGRVGGLVAVLLSDGGISCRFGQGGQAVPLPRDLRRWYEAQESQTISSQQLASLLRAPSTEVPGFSLRPPAPFDVNTEESTYLNGRKVQIGSVHDRALRPTAPFDIPLESINRHALISGATGSGKTQTTKRLLVELHRQGIPWLVIEPAKHEYRALAEATDATVIRIGDLGTPPMGLNILEPQHIINPDDSVERFPLETHIDMVNALFQLSFQTKDPFPQILATSLRRVYSDMGWSIPLGAYKRASYGPVPSRGQRHERYPNLAALRQAAMDVVEDTGYAGEDLANMSSYIDVRIGSLCAGTPANFLDNSHPIDMHALLDRNVIIEIEDVGNDRDKSFVVGAIILRLYELLRLLGPVRDGDLRHVVVVEEAHRLLRSPAEGATGSQSVELFSSLLSEVRAFGEGVVIVEQIPTKLISDVVKNTAVQLVHRLPSSSDRDAVGSAMNLSEAQSDYLVSLPPGTAAAFREGMDQPVLIGVDRVEFAGTGYGLPPADLHSDDFGLVCAQSCPDEVPTRQLSEELTVVSGDLPELSVFLEITIELMLVGRTPLPTNEPWVGRFQARLDSAEKRTVLIRMIAARMVQARWARIADFWNPHDVVRSACHVTESILNGSAVKPDVWFPSGIYYTSELRERKDFDVDSVAQGFGQQIAEAIAGHSDVDLALRQSEYGKFLNDILPDGASFADACRRCRPGATDVYSAGLETTYGRAALAKERLQFVLRQRFSVTLPTGDRPNRV